MTEIKEIQDEQDYNGFFILIVGIVVFLWGRYFALDIINWLVMIIGVLTIIGGLVSIFGQVKEFFIKK